MWTLTVGRILASRRRVVTSGKDRVERESCEWPFPSVSETRAEHGRSDVVVGSSGPPHAAAAPPPPGRRAGHRVKRSIRFGRPSSQSVGRPQPPPLLRLRCRPFPLGRSQRQNFRRSFRLRSGGHSFGLRRSLEDKILVRPRLRSPSFWLRARDKRFRLRLEARSFVLTSIWRPPFRSPSVSGPEYWSWSRP